MSDLGTEDEPWEEESTPDKESGLESLKCSSEKELSQRIVAQLEFYFSDDFIMRDSFLLKHVRRKREGYVSLKLLASYRKMKGLTKNWELVRKALLSFSTRLEVNADGTKVRRREPLPDCDETVLCRTVVAYPLSISTNVEAVAEMFSGFGPISLLRMLRPGAVVPPCVRRFLLTHPEASVFPAAVVEFERRQDASQALTLGNRLLHVVPLVPSPNTATARANIAATESRSVHESSKRQSVVPSLGTVSGSAFGARSKTQCEGDASTSVWVKKCPEGKVLVLRQPRGPDGTRGFHHPRRTAAHQLLQPP